MKVKSFTFVLLFMVVSSVTAWAAVTKTQVAELYVATFNRAPDSTGLNYWVNDSFNGNPDIDLIAMSFFDQPETQALYPADNTDEQFVRAIYDNLFNRDPDPDGLAYWTGEDGLGGGMHRSVMIQAVKNGATGTDAEIIANKAEVAMYYADELGMGGTDFSLADVTDDPETVANAKRAVDHVKDLTPAIELSRTVVELETGESINITISGGSGNFSVVNSNTQVASAWITGNNLGITGLSGGTITLVVTDAEGMSADVLVTITPSNIYPGTCGAFVSPGVWKEFDCYNLAAIGKTTGDDPFTPSWRLIGGYWQWGRKGPDPSQWYDTNTPHFAHGPTGPGSEKANEGEISNWDYNYAPDGAWSDSYKTANDPCPDKFRVPTKTQWEGVFSNNTVSTVGTWSTIWDDYNNYSAAHFLGSGLMLPAAGFRIFSSGEMSERGYGGGYWSSSQGAGYSWLMYFGSEFADTYDAYRRGGGSVRCVAE